MTLTPHTLSPKHGSRSKSFRIGRGPGTGRGKTAGRGTKGQRARTGGRKNLKLKGLKQMILGFPKMRGFQSLNAKPATITLTQLNVFPAGTTVALTDLRAKGMLHRNEHSAKVVGSGTLEKKLTLVGLFVSASAKAAVEKAGGSVTFKTRTDKKKGTKGKKK